MSVKDMYADLEKIEARGKRKKEKRGGLFSSFGKKDELEPDVENSQPTSPTPPPAKEVPKPEPSPPKEVPKPEPVKEAPRPKPKPVPVKEVPKPAPVKEIPTPEPVVSKPAVSTVQTPPPTPAKPTWKPLTGSKLKKAEEDLLEYKKWLNKGYKSGMMTKEHCTEMVYKKERELGLRSE